jgi:Na+-transporting NADH:ubiquinone oxidoreductase subunit NqrB
MQQSIFKDARYFQLLFQSSFLLYGFFGLNWSADIPVDLCYFITAILTAILIQVLFFKHAQPVSYSAKWKSIQPHILSAIISSLSLSLLLKTNHWYIAILAAVIAIGSKYLLRWNGKHIFNPSALAIVVTVYFTGQTWVSPGQWGNHMILFFGVCTLGYIVTTRVQQLDISLAFLLTYILLLFIRQRLQLGWPIDFFLQSITTGSLLLFSFFMISDPKTSPNHRVGRIIWAVIIAGVSFYLSTFQFIQAAPIWVMVLTQPIVPLIYHLFKAKKFEWQTTSQVLVSNNITQ